MLRRASTEDLPLVAGLIATQPKTLLQQDADWIARIAGDPDNHVMIWDRDGFAGFALIERSYPEVYCLTNLAVSMPGRGEGKALIAAVLGLVFADLGAHRFFLDTGADNLRAQAAFLAAGFKHEGVLRKCWRRGEDGWVDCQLLAILREEWEAARAT